MALHSLILFITKYDSLSPTDCIRSKAILTTMPNRQYGSDKAENYLLRFAPRI